MTKLTYRQKLTMLTRANKICDVMWDLGCFTEFKKFAAIAGRIVKSMETHADNRLIAN